MTGRLLVSLVALLGATLPGCTGGGDSGPTCRFDDPATMIAPSAWPKFRHDAQNTGTTNSLVSANPRMKWVFPMTDEPAAGPFAASPVLNGVAGTLNSATRVYIGSTDGYLYAVDPTDGTQDTAFSFFTAQPITSTALVSQRFGADALFFGAGDGVFYGVDSDGAAQATNWPPAISGYISSSPALSMVDGTVFTASLGGFIAGVCPNGVPRFFLTSPSVQSSPAIGADGTVYLGGDDQQLRALRVDGVLLWTFGASSSILNAPVVAVANEATTAIYVADRGGLIFKVNGGGQQVSAFKFPQYRKPDGTLTVGAPVGPISSSPALDLTANRLYVGSDDGNLYAVDADSGEVMWIFTPPCPPLPSSDCPPLMPIVSSPAVATGDREGNVIVVGSNDGNVYFVRDTGPEGVQINKYTIPVGKDGTVYAVRSSPAIGDDGTVYIGADDGRLYAIQ